MRFKRFFQIAGPGLLVAATGVGAGDLATAAFAGSKLGVAVLWAVLLGAFFKFVLNEGLTRWQLSTGTTILKGALTHGGLFSQWIFLAYFFLWSYLVAAALMSAAGAALYAILPVCQDPYYGKIIYGVLQSILGFVIVYFGGFQLFEKIMKVCIVVMFFAVVYTAWRLSSDWLVIIKSLVWPNIWHLSAAELMWVVALIGGVGGTVTILCYGYWIREKGLVSKSDLFACRVDLGIGYIMTALFGLGMVIIGSHVHPEGKGTTLIIKLGERLVLETGALGKWIFLAGGWSAIFSSLLGVWQSVPYIFADAVTIMQKSDVRDSEDLSRTKLYRYFLIGLSLVPMTGLYVGFASMQKVYAFVGALFIPLLTIVLLVLGREKFIGQEFKNKPLTNLVLIFILVFFLGTFILSFC